ncbi:MAG TPA: Mur ligase family protein, partial [Candidatus Glassbacteria bacterium]|nr:Mur ligase family protein [Candidatus Glassbacteria bacterium]
MKLTAILGAIGAASDPSRTFGVNVEGLAIDSRKVSRGDLFFAIPGEKTDGHDFLEQARQKGAAGAVVSRRVEGSPLEQFVVPDTRRALALAACEFYGHPSYAIPLVGITGTNGKTTIAFLVRQILKAEGIKCGLLGTIYNIIAEEEIEPSELTTAMAHDIQRLLARIRERGNRAAVMEVSS